MIPFSTFLQCVHVKVVWGTSELGQSKHLNQRQSLLHHLNRAIPELGKTFSKMNFPLSNEFSKNLLLPHGQSGSDGQFLKLDVWDRHNCNYLPKSLPRVSIE